MAKNWKCIECGALVWNRYLRCKKHAYVGDKNSNWKKGLFGDKNPNWRGGTAKNPYTSRFKRIIRYEVLEAFPSCQMCGTKEDLVVHHMNHNRKDNEGLNLITLCRACNFREIFHQQYYAGYFSTKHMVRMTDTLYYSNQGREWGVVK